MEIKLTTFSLGSNRWRRKNLLRYIHCSSLKLACTIAIGAAMPSFNSTCSGVSAFDDPAFCKIMNNIKALYFQYGFDTVFAPVVEPIKYATPCVVGVFEIHTHSMSVENLSQWHLFERWCPRADLNHRNEGLQSGNIWLIYFNQYDPHRYIW